MAKFNIMFSSLKHIFQKFINLGAEEDHVEHQSTSLKRTVDVADLDDNPSHKRRCVETALSSQIKFETNYFSSRIQPSNSHINIMAESKRPGISTMSKKGNYLCNSDLMQSKGSGPGRSSSQNLNHGKENNVIEVSDDEESNSVKFVGVASKSNSLDSTWVDAVPKLNPIHRSLQSTSSEHLRKIRNPVKGLRHDVLHSDKTGFQIRTPSLPSVVIPRPLSEHTSTKMQRNKKPTGLHRLQRYSSQASSIKRCVDTSIRLDEKIKFAELVKQYQGPHNSHLSSRLARSNKGISVDYLIRCAQNQAQDIEVVDLTRAKKLDSTPGVRHDLEAKPETLATKIANIGISSTSKQKAPIPQSNSIEEMLKSSVFCGPNYLTNTSHKFVQKNIETVKDMQEPLTRVKRYGRQNDKDCMKQIEDRVRRHMKITETDIVLDDVLEEPQPELPTLTSRMQKAIDSALIPKPPNECLTEDFSLRITRRDMYTLANLNWLNDEVINFYMNLLIERGKLEKYPDIYAFNTFFYSKLITGGHAVLRRWTRKIDIFSYKLIIIPIHLGVHWCMAAIDFRDKTIRYYDSMGNPNNKCLQVLIKYLEEESLDKKKIVFDASVWNKVNVKDIPQQMNGSDCGVFACMYAEFICRQAKINFTQKTMPYFRRKMVYEILNCQLLDW